MVWFKTALCLHFLRPGFSLLSFLVNKREYIKVEAKYYILST